MPNTLEVLRRLPRTVRLLVLGMLINKAGGFILPFLTLVLRREMGLAPGTSALLVSAYGLGSLASIVTGGWLTDRLGRRRTLLLSLFGSGALAVGMGLAPSFSAFVPLLVLFGFLSDLYRPASSAIIGDLLPSAQRATGFAALRLAVNLGFAVGTSLGGLLVDWSWRFAFALDGITTLAFGLVVLRGVLETRPAVVDRGAVAEGHALADPVFRRVLFASFGFAMIVFSLFTALPLSVTEAGYPPVVYGVVVGANGLLIALFEVPIVAALAGLRRLRVAALGFVLCGAGLAVVGLRPHWSVYLASVLLWTAGEILALPQLMSFVADWAPPAARGRYLGWHGATWSLGWSLNPLLFLPLQARLGSALFWPLHLAAILPAALVTLGLDAVDRPERLRGHSLAPENAGPG